VSQSANLSSGVIFSASFSPLALSSSFLSFVGRPSSPACHSFNS
jgi:hypothetical protein